MANKQSFTPEEWTKLMESVALTGMAVTAADPSGLIGIVQESFANAGTIVKAKSDPASNELVKAVIAEFENSEGRSKVREAMKVRFANARPADVSQRSLDALRDISKLLDAKAPQDSAAFKTWLGTIGSNVASSATEGGVLGFGGEKVSDKEKATLSEIAKALGVAA